MDAFSGLASYAAPSQTKRFRSTRVELSPGTVDPREVCSTLPIIIELDPSDNESLSHDASSIYSTLGSASRLTSPALHSIPFPSYSEAPSPSPSDVPRLTLTSARRRRPALASPYRPQLPGDIVPPGADSTTIQLCPSRQTGEKSKRDEDDDGEERRDNYISRHLTGPAQVGLRGLSTFNHPAHYHSANNFRSIPQYSSSSSMTSPASYPPLTRPTKRARQNRTEAAHIQCPHCSKEFKQTKDLNRHIRVSCVGVSRVEGHKCGICGLLLSRPDALLRHRKSKSCKKAAQKEMQRSSQKSS